MFANPNLIYHDTFVICSITRLLVCVRMRMSTSIQYANVYVKSLLIGPRSSAGVPLSQAAPAYLITVHYLCAFLLYLARWLCGGLNKKKILIVTRRCNNGSGGGNYSNVKRSVWMWKRRFLNNIKMYLFWVMSHVVLTEIVSNLKMHPFHDVFSFAYSFHHIPRIQTR